jgi:hypothetical protein
MYDYKVFKKAKNILVVLPFKLDLSVSASYIPDSSSFEYKEVSIFGD